MATLSAQQAWQSWEIDESAIAGLPAVRRLNLLRHACLIHYPEKAALVYTTGGPWADADLRVVAADLAARGQPDTLRALLSAGFYPPAGLNDMLRTAADFSRIDMAAFLLTLGADIRLDNDALFLQAAAKADIPLLSFCLAAADYPQPLLSAAAELAVRNNKRDVLATLLDAGFDIAAGNHALVRQIAASPYATQGFFDLLQTAGADLRGDCERALQAAIEGLQALNVTRLVTRHGADPLLLPDSAFDAGFDQKSLSPALMAGIENGAAQARDRLPPVADWPALLPASPALLTEIVRAGELATLVDLVAGGPAAGRAVISPAVLQHRLNDSVTTLDLICRTGQLRALLAPALWAGRAEELDALKKALGEERCGALPAVFFEAIAAFDEADRRRDALGRAPRPPRFGP